MKLSVLLEDVEDVVVPAVFADQAASSERGMGAGFSIGFLSYDASSDGDSILLGVEPGTDQQTIVDDERVAERPELDRQSAADGTQEELAGPLDEVDGLSPLAKRPPARRTCPAGSGCVVSRAGSGRPCGRQHQPQRGLGDVAGDPVGAIRGRDHDGPELGVGQGLELGREAVDCPAVADPPVFVELRKSEAEPERGDRPAWPSWGSIIDSEGLGLDENAPGRVPRRTGSSGNGPGRATVETRLPAGPVPSRKRRRGDGLAVVGPHHSVGHCSRQLGARLEARARHAQRLEEGVGRSPLANGSPRTRSTTAPTTAMPALEYFVRVPGSKTRVVPARLRTTSSSDGGSGSK